jgi:hypothetical protein
MAIRHDDSLHLDHIYLQRQGRQPALAQFATLTAPTRATFLRQAENFTPTARHRRSVVNDSTTFRNAPS